MERKGITIFSVCIAVIFTAALVIFGAAMYIEYGKNENRIQAVAADFIRNAADMSEYYAPGSSEFTKALRNKIDSEQNIAAISITQNDKTIFAYPLSSPLIIAASDGSPKLATSSSLVKLTSRAANLGTVENAVITAAMYVIRPAVIYTYARISFLLILAGTLSAVILLLYLHLTERQNDDEPRKTKTAEVKVQVKPAKEVFKPYFEPAEPLDMHIEDSDFPPAEAETDELSVQDMLDEQTTESENVDKPAQTTDTPDPTGLFSPITGFGWASYLEERLDSELIRSASSEEDLALLIIRFPGLDRTSELAKNIGILLLDFFKFRDMVFEYDKDGFSGILHDTDLENTIDLAEELNSKLNILLEESGFTAKTGIGISTRSFRLIPGRRLFTEAEQALVHALKDQETSIVAFRVDPDKYRQYISESAQNAAKEQQNNN